jgi:hypothetical protein
MAARMPVERLHHVQLAMPAGGEARARQFHQGLLGIPEAPKLRGYERVFVDDPFGNRIELLEPTRGPA